MRELTKEELQRVQELTDFCVTRMRPSRDICTAIACFRLGEEGEQISELDRILIDPKWSTEEQVQHLRDFALESFVAMTENARCYSDIQNYTLVACNEQGKAVATRALMITPDQPGERKVGGSVVEKPTDVGERRQLMRHTEEAFRMSERTTNKALDHILQENSRLCAHSLAREGQLMAMTDKYFEMMIKTAEREHERAKIDLEVERMRRKEARYDKLFEMGMKHVAPKLLGVSAPPPSQLPAKPDGKAAISPAYVRFINALNAEQREAIWTTLDEEQRAIFLEVIASLEGATTTPAESEKDYAERSQKNGAS